MPAFTRTLSSLALGAAAALSLSACAGAPVTADPAPGGRIEPELPPAPWSAESLASTAVPEVYLREWAGAENRESCALLAPAATGEPDAEARGARFTGGWGVAYDLPGRRSAFGVAGTGAEAASPSYDAWPHRRAWADGSTAGYGPEGGSGPNRLAYLRVPGQACLYNVWSRLGTEHLEHLLEELRFVRISGADPSG